MAKKKEYRSLKISSIWNYGSNPSPQLRLQGRWLEELGFQIGEAVLVKCEDGKLIITPDTIRAETESREKEFLDREMALLQKSFDAEKQKIRQQIVAEREAIYVAEGRLSPMFDANELASLDSNYFTVIYKDIYDVTIKSNNTGHYWSLHSPGYPEPGTVIIFHSHFASCPYHQHGRATSLRQAVKSIKSHDRFQLNGRKPVRR